MLLYFAVSEEYALSSPWNGLSAFLALCPCSLQFIVLDSCLNYTEFPYCLRRAGSGAQIFFLSSLLERYPNRDIISLQMIHNLSSFEYWLYSLKMAVDQRNM
jgi:hypothetical protein